MLREFLAELDEIYVKNHVGLQESLKIMCKHSNEKKKCFCHFTGKM